MTTYLDAMFFSIETMYTIGYGAAGDSIYFSECSEMFVVVFINCYIGITLNALFISIIMFRLSRVQPRANTLIFSDKAVVQRIGGAYYFQFRVCELRRHQLTEAHVRCYCFRNSKDATLPGRSHGRDRRAAGGGA